MLFNALMATVEAGDEVVIPAPCSGRLSGHRQDLWWGPVILDCPQAENFLLTPAQPESHYTKDPLGDAEFSQQPFRGHSAEQYAALLDLIDRNPHVWLLSDEIYEHLVYDGVQHSSALNVAPQLKPRCLIVNGVSKAYAMTGWRIGYSAAPAELTSAMVAVQGRNLWGFFHQSGGGVPGTHGPQDEVQRRREAFEGRRNLVVGMLNQATGISCANPQGAFYVFPSWRTSTASAQPRARQSSPRWTMWTIC